MLIAMATIAQSRKDRLRLKLLIRDDAPDRRQHRQAVGGCAQGMRARVQLRKILHLLLPRAGPGASHAHAHPNRLPKLRPHRCHVSDVAAYLGALAVRARGLHQARQPGEIADRDAGGEGGRAGCVGSLRSDGGPNQGRSVERSGCMRAAAMRRPHDDQCSAPPRTRPATGGAVPCLGCSPTGCVS
jgi:hypothetical protein